MCTIEPSLAQEQVTVSGSSTVVPLAEAAAEAFNAKQQVYRASVTGGGTGAGITGIAEGRSDMAMASREVTSDEIARYGDKFHETLIGYDGIVIIVSKQIYESGVTDLSTKQLKGIYLGEIDNWKDVGGPDEEIYVVGREPGSGTRDAFNEKITGNIKAETIGTQTMGSAEAKTAVTGNDKGIGYVGYSYAEGGNAKAIALDGVMPTIDTIKNGTYGLSRKLYFYTYGDPKPGAKTFTNFVLSPEGQMIAQENGFIPVTEIAENSSAEKINGVSAKRQPGFEYAFGLLGFAIASYLLQRRKH